MLLQTAKYTLECSRQVNCYPNAARNFYKFTKTPKTVCITINVVVNLCLLFLRVGWTDLYRIWRRQRTTIDAHNQTKFEKDKPFVSSLGNHSALKANFCTF